MNPITVLIVDDHKLFREGLRSLLSLESDLLVVGEAENGREAVKLAQRLRPAVIVMDIAMPLLNGLEAARKIRGAHPKTRILILSAYADEEYMAYLTQVGAHGYLIKQTSAHALAAGIRKVNAGKTVFPESIMKRITWPRDCDATFRRGKGNSLRLTPRELEVLQSIAEGHGNKQIASGLSISIKTVEKHRQSLMDKLDIHETAGLTRYAISAGLIASHVRVAPGLFTP